ncbi:MAG: hypothetical protein WC464_00280 [Bdellovibrionales bacterium]|jgi:hypothetical protein
MISKELLREVWKWKYATIKDCRVAGKHIEVTFNETNSKDKINIYELVHKCKEWAMNQQYSLRSEIYRNGCGYVLCEPRTSGLKDSSFTGSTEPESIFKACQWILDNKDK